MLPRSAAARHGAPSVPLGPGPRRLLAGRGSRPHESTRWVASDNMRPPSQRPRPRTYRGGSVAAGAARRQAAPVLTSVLLGIIAPLTHAVSATATFCLAADAAVPAEPLPEVRCLPYLLRTALRAALRSNCALLPLCAPSSQVGTAAHPALPCWIVHYGLCCLLYRGCKCRMCSCCLTLSCGARPAAPPTCCPGPLPRRPLWRRCCAAATCHQPPQKM